MTHAVFTPAYATHDPPLIPLIAAFIDALTSIYMNMTSMRIIIGVLALVAVPFVISQTGTDVESLSTDCQNKLNQIWSNYTDSAYLIESCDSDCLSACVGTLQEAIYSTKSSECPTQEDIARCFNVRLMRACTLVAFKLVCSPSAPQSNVLLSQLTHLTANAPMPAGLWASMDRFRHGVPSFQLQWHINSRGGWRR